MRQIEANINQLLNLPVIEAALTFSGVTGAVLTATDAGSSATITISSHTRLYGDSTSVSVNTGSVTGLAYDTVYYIYYDQASRLGGAVTYQATTVESVAAQLNDRHLVGSVKTPPALGGATNGLLVRPSGLGSIR